MTQKGTGVAAYVRKRFSEIFDAYDLTDQELEELCSDKSKKKFHSTYPVLSTERRKAYNVYRYAKEPIANIRGKEYYITKERNGTKYGDAIKRAVDDYVAELSQYEKRKR